MVETDSLRPPAPPLPSLAPFSRSLLPRCCSICLENKVCSRWTVIGNNGEVACGTCAGALKAVLDVRDCSECEETKGSSRWLQSTPSGDAQLTCVKCYNRLLKVQVASVARYCSGERVARLSPWAWGGWF